MKLIDRTLYISQLQSVVNTPDIKILTGIRRSGKSKLLEAFALRIKAQEPMANIIAIDLTKLKFEALKEYHALNDYIESKYVQGVNNYLMIDEIQMCPNFELTINSLHSEDRYDIYITGSNAFLLSSDLATLFTGRHVEIPVFPFSFQEFCIYHNIDSGADIQAALDRYILIGGLSGSYAYSRDEDKFKYIREVYNTIVVRDLVHKHKLSDSVTLNKLSEYLMDNVSNLSSSRNVSEILTSDGNKTNHITVGNYIEYLTRAFVFYEAKRYDLRGKNYLRNLSKYYLADTGIRYAKLGRRNMDWGRMLENIVYIELLRRGYEVYVGKLYQKEIDFVAMRGNEKVYLQVSDNIVDNDTFSREIEPLLKIRDAYPKILLARTRNLDYDYEGILIKDIAGWLLN